MVGGRKLKKSPLPRKTAPRGQNQSSSNQSAGSTSANFAAIANPFARGGPVRRSGRFSNPGIDERGQEAPPQPSPAKSSKSAKSSDGDATFDTSNQRGVASFNKVVAQHGSKLKRKTTNADPESEASSEEATFDTSKKHGAASFSRGVVQHGFKVRGKAKQAANTDPDTADTEAYSEDESIPALSQSHQKRAIGRFAEKVPADMVGPSNTNESGLDADDSMPALTKSKVKKVFETHTVKMPAAALIQHRSEDPLEGEARDEANIELTEFVKPPQPKPRTKRRLVLATPTPAPRPQPTPAGASANGEESFMISTPVKNMAKKKFGSDSVLMTPIPPATAMRKNLLFTNKVPPPDPVDFGVGVAPLADSFINEKSVTEKMKNATSESYPNRSGLRGNRLSHSQTKITKGLETQPSSSDSEDETKETPRPWRKGTRQLLPAHTGAVEMSEDEEMEEEDAVVDVAKSKSNLKSAPELTPRKSARHQATGGPPAHTAAKEMLEDTEVEEEDAVVEVAGNKSMPKSASELTPRKSERRQPKGRPSDHPAAKEISEDEEVEEEDALAEVAKNKSMSKPKSASGLTTRKSARHQAKGGPPAHTAAKEMLEDEVDDEDGVLEAENKSMPKSASELTPRKSPRRQAKGRSPPAHTGANEILEDEDMEQEDAVVEVAKNKSMPKPKSAPELTTRKSTRRQAKGSPPAHAGAVEMPEDEEMEEEDAVVNVAKNKSMLKSASELTPRKSPRRLAKGSPPGDPEISEESDESSSFYQPTKKKIDKPRSAAPLGGHSRILPEILKDKETKEEDAFVEVAKNKASPRKYTRRPAKGKPPGSPSQTSSQQSSKTINILVDGFDKDDLNAAQKISLRHKVSRKVQSLRPQRPAQTAPLSNSSSESEEISSFYQPRKKKAGKLSSITPLEAYSGILSQASKTSTTAGGSQLSQREVTQKETADSQMVKSIPANPGISRADTLRKTRAATSSDSDDSEAGHPPPPVAKVQTSAKVGVSKAQRQSMIEEEEPSDLLSVGLPDNDEGENMQNLEGGDGEEAEDKVEDDNPEDGGDEEEKSDSEVEEPEVVQPKRKTASPVHKRHVSIHKKQVSSTKDAGDEEESDSEVEEPEVVQPKRKTASPVHKRRVSIHKKHVSSTKDPGANSGRSSANLHSKVTVHSRNQGKPHGSPAGHSRSQLQLSLHESFDLLRKRVAGTSQRIAPTEAVQPALKKTLKRVQERIKTEEQEDQDLDVGLGPKKKRKTVDPRSNANMLSKDTIEGYMMATGQNTSKTDLNKLHKVANTMIEKFMDNLCAKTRNPNGLFTYKELEKALIEQGWLSGKKNQLAVEFGAAFTAEQLGKMRGLLIPEVGDDDTNFDDYIYD